MLEQSLQKRINEQHNKWSHRLARKKQCLGLIALCTVTKEVRLADWEDVASPGLLRGLETTSGTILEHVQDDDLMFENYCRRVQEFTAKKLSMIRDVHRRKFKADQSILQSRTDSLASMPMMSMSGAAALAMGGESGESGRSGGGGGEGGEGRKSKMFRTANSSPAVVVQNSNNSSNNRRNNNNRRRQDEADFHVHHNTPGGTTTTNAAAAAFPTFSADASTTANSSVASSSSSTRSTHLQVTRSSRTAAPRRNRITRGFSVGADIDDPETQELLLKFKRKNKTSKVNMTDFQVIKPISKGAFGQVYLCRRRKFPDLFAVKVLPKTQVDNKTDVRQVLKERKIMSNLDNPFVVDLMFSFQSESSLFLVMDFMPGGDLFSLLQNVGALAEEPRYV